MIIKSINLHLALFVVLIVATTLRFAIAPQTNLELRADTLLFQIWGYDAYKHGVLNIYDRPIADQLNTGHFVRSLNYLPSYLYILYGLEWLNRTLWPTNIIGTSISSLLYKTPAILFELATILLLTKIVFERAGVKWALGLASIYAFHPAIIFTTAGWGQVDSIYTFFLILTVWFLAKKRLLLATMFWTIAFFFKMQSIALLPLLIYEIIRPASVVTFFKSALIGVTTAALLNLPFLLGGKISSILHVIFAAPADYPRLSMNAFNFWWVASGGHGFVKSDETLILGTPLIVFGAALFFLAVTLALWFRSRVRSDEGLWITATFLIFSFFVLPTEMHERYLFPVFALLIAVIPVMDKARWLFGILSITFMLNLVASWYTIGTGDIADSLWMLGFIVATINTLLFITTSIWLIYRAINTSTINSTHNLLFTNESQ